MATSYIGVQDRPTEAVMPGTAQDVMTGTTGALVLALAAYSIYRATTGGRDPRWLIITLAAAVTIFMEPLACFMVKAHHPSVDSYVLLRGLGVTVPVQLLFFYILYFAPAGYYLIHRARQRISARQYWIDFAMLFVLLYLGEVLAVQLSVWFFFGSNPYDLFGLPLWVVLTNVSAVYAWSVAAAFCLDRLTGPRRWLAVVAAPFAAIAVYGPISLPTAIQLFADRGMGSTAPAALVSVAIGLTMIWGVRHLLALIEGHGPVAHDAEAGAGEARGTTPAPVAQAT